VKPEQVSEVIMGQVLTAGAGQMPARQSAVGAGIGWDVPALTINKMCLSGIDAIALAGMVIGVTGVALITFILLAVGQKLAPAAKEGIQIQLLVWIFTMRVMMVVASAVSYFINGAIIAADDGFAL